jgi:hypothetical protein
MKKENEDTKAVRMITDIDELYVNHQWIHGNYTNELRGIFHYKVGKYRENYGNSIPIETIFMYLFRRFGTPVLPYDDYKSLFQYGFQYGQTMFTLHGSYHEFTYLNVGINKAEYEAFFERRKAVMVPRAEALISLLLSKRLLPWSLSLNGYIEESPQYGAIQELYSELEKEELGDKYEWVLALPEGEEDTEAWEGVEKALQARMLPLIEKVEEEFNKKNPPVWMTDPHLYSWGIKKTMAWFKKEFPITYDDIIGFAKEMRKATYTRDVSFNIAGYESKPDESSVDWEQKFRVLDSALTKTYGILQLSNMLHKGMDVPRNIDLLHKATTDAYNESRIGNKINRFSGHVDYTSYTQPDLDFMVVLTDE